MTPHVLIANKKRGWNGEAAMIEVLVRGLVSRGYRVTLATNPHAALVQRLRDCQVEILKLSLLKKKPAILWTLPRDVRRLARYVRAQNVRIVHTNASFDTWVAALSIRLYHLDIPLVRTKHNLKPARDTWLNRWYYDAIHCLIAPSRAVEENLARQSFISVEKIHYIPYGLDLSKIVSFEDGKTRARKELGIPADAEVVAYISRLSRRKDPATLVRAALHLMSRRPKLRLLMVGGGDGDLLAELQGLAGNCPAIEFWGHRDDVMKILAATDVFVLPSLTEAFGLAPLEAMLQGVPTLVSDADGFRDFIEHGRNGLTFPKGNASLLAEEIDRVLEDPELRIHLATEGRRTVREYFHADRMIADIVRLYQHIWESRSQLPATEVAGL